MRLFYVCDESYERGGPERCCIFSGDEIDAMPQPSDGTLRCHRHGQLLAQGRGFYAIDHDDARRRMTEES
jgi:hypothetical protein